MDDATPQSATVEFVDDNGVKQILDFLDAPFGLKAPEVHRLSQVFSVLTLEGEDTGFQFRVMHPLHCLTSRVHNTATLPGYTSPHALRQLAFSVGAVREFIGRALVAGETRAALKIIKCVHRLSLKREGLEVFERHRIDVFTAVPVTAPELPRAYKERHHPRMLAHLRGRRERRRTGSTPRRGGSQGGT
jgi:hypothetical protein